ncbi:cupin domain-containing protein [Chitinimonas sp.]|uniref:cupin domain-containing protein n=1 Tax=Chitinimonas sp. TaxID=1934313 RepID=UPI0035B0EB70
MQRPDCIKHYLDIQEADDARYPGSEELLSIGAPFGRVFGLSRIGIHHETLPPGRRTSWPHAESTEEEFVYVLEGAPDVWLDGELHRLQAGDGVGFKPGDGLAHTFINNSDSVVRLLVVGERKRPDNQVHYPMHPQRNAEIGELWWRDHPQRPLAGHDGLPDAQRQGEAG